MRILIYLILLLYPFNLISGQKKQKRLSDDELMTLVQKQTFRYFWDFAHPESGLAHERSNGGAETATIGGSGFGVMAIIVGIERGFITREQGAERILKIVRFLSDKNTDSYHGMWAHWMNGKTGKTIPFSRKDDGADIIIVDPGSLSVLGPVAQAVVVASRIDPDFTVFYLVQQLFSCLRRHRRSLRQIGGFRQFGNDGSGICSHHCWHNSLIKHNIYFS